MRRLSVVLALAVATLHFASPRALAAADGENPLSGLAPLLGRWGVPPAVAEARAELQGRVVHDYAWTVGQNALRVRESYALGDAAGAELQGLVYWHPGTGALELRAVAGPGAEQGRVFVGEYRVLADGRIERVYDVHYRTPEDTPGEELGGSVRRYREVYTIEGDALTATLEWWRDGAWQPFGPGEYSLVRIEDSV
jgi:hypothetical protein